MRFLLINRKMSLWIFIALSVGFSCGCAPRSQETWQLVGATNVSSKAAGDESLVFYKDTLYLAYRDAAKADQVTVRKYDGKSWTSVGQEGFSPKGITTYVSLAVDPAKGVLYVAYELSKVHVIRKPHTVPTISVSSQIFVQKYDGKKWVIVGGKVAGKGQSPSLFLHKGEPCVIYGMDSANGMGIGGFKYDGGSWVAIGKKALITYGIPYTWGGVATDQKTGNNFISFLDAKYKQAFIAGYDGKVLGILGGSIPGTDNSANGSVWTDDSGLYLAYQDQTHGKRAAVARYDGKGWGVLQGNASDGPVDSMSLVVDHGTPLLAYADGARKNKITVMEYMNGSWSSLGLKGFSQGMATYESLALDSVSHILYVAFKDTAHGDKAAVMAYRLFRP
jgi:hypothetical protein